MLQMILSRSGYGKTYKIGELIKSRIDAQPEIGVNAAGNAHSNIILLVPEQISFESEREMLHLLGEQSLRRISVLSFKRLCNEFFSIYGGKNKKAIDITGKTAVMELALQKIEGELELFRRQARKPSFCEQMLNFITEMKQCAVSPDKLNTLSEQTGGVLSKKLIEISKITSLYESLISNEYYDPTDDLTKITNMLPTCPFFKGKSVYIDAFSGFTAQQMKLLEGIIAMADEVYITLGCDAADSGEYTLFSNITQCAAKLKSYAKNNGVQIMPDCILTDSRRFKNEPLCHLERNIFAPDFAVYDEPAPQITVCKAKTVYDEADYVAHTLRKLVRTTDLRYREVAVIARDASRYKGIIETAFKRCNIPCFTDDRKGVETMAIFKFCTYAMQAVIGGIDTENIMMMLKTGVCPFDDTLIAELDIYTEIWQIRGADWFNEFTGNPDGADGEMSDDGKSRLITLNEMREKIIGALKKLQAAFSSSSAREMSAAIYRLMKEFSVDESLRKIAAQSAADGFADRADDERRSFDIMISMLDQMTFSLHSIPVEGSRYYDLFCCALALLDIGSLPQGLDEVAIGSAARMRPKSPKITFIIGANEGIFPALSSGASVFSPPELKQMKAKGVELIQCDEYAAIDEQYLAYTALCSASEAVYVTYAGTDIGSEALQPSIIIDCINKMFPLCIKTEAKRIYPANEVENESEALRLFCSDADETTVDAASAAYCLRESSSRFYSAVKEADKRKLELSQETAQALYGKNIYTSATKLDIFHKCKFYYFCKYGVKAKPIRAAKLNVLSRGSLIHYVLQKMLSEQEVERVLAMSNDELADTVGNYCTEYMSVITSGRTLDTIEQYQLEQLTDSIVSLTLRIFEELDQSLFSVAATELSIGGDADGIEKFELKLNDGTSVYLTGSIDRVDIYETDRKKYVRILDYKTGMKNIKLSDIAYGQNLQMLVYMNALMKNGGKKYEKMLPSGLLYVRALEKTVSEEQDADDKKIKEKQLRALKMNGLLLADEQAINAMEPDGIGLFIPKIFNKDGSIGKNAHCYTLEQFALLAKHSERLLADMSRSLRDGELSISPLDGESEACKYCDYGSVCLFEGTPECIPCMPDSEIMRLIKEENDG